MVLRAIGLTLVVVTLANTPSMAWDPVGDITQRDRFIRNVGRETGNAVRDIPNVPRNVGREIGNVGREIDRARLEAMVQAAAPGFQQWLQASRNTAASGGPFPIPAYIRSQLEGFYSADTLNRARFKVGDGGVFNLANLAITYGNQTAAVTLIDVIVFRNEYDAQNNPVLWAHELRHVEQFRDWGVRDFAIRYLRSGNGVENEAYAKQAEFANRQNQQFAGPLPPQAPPPQFGPLGPFGPPAAQVCATPMFACQMVVAFPPGQTCQCMTPSGPIIGMT